MPLPPKPFHPVGELAARWQVDALAIVGWAIEGRLALSAALPQIGIAEGQTASGLLGVAGEDVFALFDGEPCVKVRRFRRDSRSAWEAIAHPADGIALRGSGIVIARAEAARFEQAHRLFVRDDRPRAPERPSIIRAGAPARYDWDAFAGAVARRVFDHGMPQSQGELVRDMLDWFAECRGATPDESTVRRRVQAAWRELTRPA
jgi:hypothetical protein